MLDLTALEYQIFEYLIRHSLKIVSKQQILDSLYDQGEGIQLNNIEVIVSRLRKKLAQHTEDKLISTVRGQGYRFEIEAK